MAKYWKKIQPSGHTVRVQHFDCVRFVFFAEQSLAETKSAVASALVPAQVVKRLTEAWHCPGKKCGEQCDQIWPKFRHFGNILKVLGNYVKAYLVLGKYLNLLWSTFYAIGQIFIAANGLILTNNPAIWSHWTGEEENSSCQKKITETFARGVNLFIVTQKALIKTLQTTEIILGDSLKIMLIQTSLLFTIFV